MQVVKEFDYTVFALIAKTICGHLQGFVLKAEALECSEKDVTKPLEVKKADAKAERKKMWIKLAIESNEFHTFSENLRVHGIIQEAQFDLGSYHTHIVEVRDEIEISVAKISSRP